MNETDFLKAIEAEQANPVPRLVYADWLDEQGDPRGELLRIQEELRHLNVPQRAKKERRMHELLNEGVEPLTITHTSSIGMQEVLIFPGEFMMGSPETEEGRYENENQVEARLTQGFWLGKSAVTQAEWQQVMGTRPWEGEIHVLEAPDCPATLVGWEDAMNFCRTLTQQEHQLRRLSEEWIYTLPTEAQWEYACRAGTTSRYSFGEDDSELGHFAWFEQNTGNNDEDYPHPVGQKQPNPWGLLDVHGNVLEWCRDWYNRKLPGGRDPNVTIDGSFRVYRGGGCWGDTAESCRSAIRLYSHPLNRQDEVGFRMVRVLSSK